MQTHELKGRGVCVCVSVWVIKSNSIAEVEMSGVCEAMIYLYEIVCQNGCCKRRKGDGFLQAYESRSEEEI